MKTIFSILFFCCLSQNVDAKTVTVRGQIADYDTIEMAEIIVLLTDKKEDNNTIQVKVDSVGQFELILLKCNLYELKVYSKKYYNLTETLRYLSRKEKSITIELQKRENPLVFVPVPSFNYTQKISKSDSSTISIKGKVFDEAGEFVMFANVTVYRNGALVTGVQTDFDGEFEFSNLEYGLYDIEVGYVGYSNTRFKNIMVTNNEITFVNITMKSGIETGGCCGSHYYSVPLIEIDNTTQGTTFSDKEIQRSPHKN